MCKYCLESNTKLLLKIETPWQSPNRKYAEIWSIQFCFGFTVGLSRNNDIKDIAAIAFFSWLSLIYHTFDILFGFNESKKIMNVYKYTTFIAIIAASPFRITFFVVSRCWFGDSYFSERWRKTKEGESLGSLLKAVFNNCDSPYFWPKDIYIASRKCAV